MMKFDIQTTKDARQTVPLAFCGTNPKTGETLGVTNKCFIKDGEPWFPVMGEFHYARYPAPLWEREILKIKAGGITILSTYIFWIHHEEEEGVFDWTDCRNLDIFLSLCGKHGLKVFLRVGPWAHGECRNGGFPDWLMQKECEQRSDNPEYLSYVERFFGEIAGQSRHHLFKDGGCVIGVQIENEYGHCGGFTGEKGFAHMRTLKRMIVDAGLDVPYYTATGWGGAVVVGDEMLPVLGAYADAPWDRSIGELPASVNFLFSRLLNDENIGSDLKSDPMYKGGFTYSPALYPFATAELGGGIQVTGHRRPVITAHDTQAMIYSKLGSGSNLLGYYMYHGGTNPKGKLGTLQESFATGGYNDLPELSYDFQGAIGEYGEPHQSYRYLKILHMMINDFGSGFADGYSVIPKKNGNDPEDMESLRFSFITGNRMSLLCLNNHQRHRKMTAKKNIEISVDGTAFPPFDLEPDVSICFPYQWDCFGINIGYATAQPLCKLKTEKGHDVFFWNYGEKTELCLNGCEKIVQAGEALSVINPEGETVRLILLSREQAENAWKVSIGGRQALLITSAGVLNPEHDVSFYGLTQSEECLFCPPDLWEGEKQGIFGKTILRVDEGNTPVPIAFTELSDTGEAKTYRFTLPENWEALADEAFLFIDFEGDQASLYHDEERIADWFYTGLPWRIGLAKFVGKLGGELILRIDPLRDDAAIYLEKPPRYVDHVACALHKLEIERQFHASIG